MPQGRLFCFVVFFGFSLTHVPWEVSSSLPRTLFSPLLHLFFGLIYSAFLLFGHKTGTLGTRRQAPFFTLFYARAEGGVRTLYLKTVFLDLTLCSICSNLEFLRKPLKMISSLCDFQELVLAVRWLAPWTAQQSLERNGYGRWESPPGVVCISPQR